MPKVLHTLSGRAMIDYPVMAALAVSDDVQVVLFHEAERLEAHINEEFPLAKCVRQDHLRFPGTGGAVMAAAPKHDRIVVLNGDMPLIDAGFVRSLAAGRADATLAVFISPNPTGYGRVVIKKDRVLRIVEEKDADAETKAINTINGGAYAFSAHFLRENLPKLTNQNAQNEFYITDLIALANESGREVSAVWGDSEILMGVNSKAELAIAENIHQARLKESLMIRGVLMRLPETIFIDANATFEGECVVENGVVVLGKSRVTRSTIKAHSVIEDSIVTDSDVGPFAHLRPNCEISNTHIGNFVETKKARLNGVKAGHLSYLGDVEIDEGTNIGAGTITCNYDGKNKHKTVIGKNVFIGSDTQLVAPVTIPDNVLIGAGTTVTKNPNEGDLVLSRSPQKSFAGFFARFFGKKP
ncbi:bifunctional protein GlmU [Campylobacterota bacterium]|nr:bifunctional protein GlmU [Campylobacterota bacterium]